MAILYPGAIDNDSTLYLVRDSLRLRLAEDYVPGNTSILVEGDQESFNRFPTTGIVTLTEQCSDPEKRSISFFYSSKGDFSFLNLQLIPDFPDSFKPKRITSVTLSVVAQHHNSLASALIAIENFVGVKGEIASTPLSGTMEARINFLRRLVLQPRAWFTTKKRIGIVPLCLVFEDQSTRNPNSWYWDFGDGTDASIIRVPGISTGQVSHCFYTPGIYTITLNVENQYGNNSIAIEDYITARVEAPNAATIDFSPSADQILSGGVLRTRTGRPVLIQVTDNGENPLDPVVKYIWDLQDDLTHDDTDQAIAQYSIGGYFDVKVDTQTQLGAYRITTFENAIDVVEVSNLWHFIFDTNTVAVTKNLKCYEFGLLSEIYKTASPAVTTVTRDYNFLTGQPNQSNQVREFRRNNGVCPMNTIPSGNRGVSMLYWATGASANNLPQFIKFIQFNGFDGIYSSPLINSVSDEWPRFWNWLSLPSLTEIHFLLGVPGVYPQPSGSPVNMNQDTVFLNNLATTTTAFQPGNLLNGATSLQNNAGAGSDGDYSVYRSAWKDSTGYFVRNESSGVFFRINGFYQTETTSIGQEIENIRKLDNIPGNAKLEGQLLSLADGIYFFNNTGEVCLYSPTENLWRVGGPGVNSAAFRNLQDQTVSGFDNPANTLVACSDGSTKAYLFFDYSVSSDIMYDSIGSVFRSLPPRPSGEQFLATIY